MGRADGPGEGRAPRDQAARLAGRTLVLAGPVQTGRRLLPRVDEPHVDGRGVHYVGEVAGVAKQELFANAAALLMPFAGGSRSGW